MKCLVCKTTFNKNDIPMIKEDEDRPICDICSINTIEMHVKYDGSRDLLEHLKEYTPLSRICSSCSANALELKSIVFGSPIEGLVQCSICKIENEIYIYLEMV